MEGRTEQKEMKGVRRRMDGRRGKDDMIGIEGRRSKWWEERESIGGEDNYGEERRRGKGQ